MAKRPRAAVERAGIRVARMTVETSHGRHAVAPHRDPAIPGARVVGDGVEGAAFAGRTVELDVDPSGRDARRKRRQGSVSPDRVEAGPGARDLHPSSGDGGRQRSLAGSRAGRKRSDVFKIAGGTRIGDGERYGGRGRARLRGRQVRGKGDNCCGAGQFIEVDERALRVAWIGHAALGNIVHARISDRGRGVRADDRSVSPAQQICVWRRRWFGGRRPSRRNGGLRSRWGGFLARRGLGRGAGRG